MQEVASQRAPLTDVLVDDVTWRCATRVRRAEWTLAISELVEEAVLQIAADVPSLRAQVLVESSGITVSFVDPRGVEVGRLAVTRLTIAPVFREYMKILRSLGQGDLAEVSPHYEALDIARRLVHDDAAELLQRHCEGVHPDRPTARRMFTLLVLLTHDTTKLHAVPQWPT
jgi:uncharacterized protein (UPF0262 family)